MATTKSYLTFLMEQLLEAMEPQLPLPKAKKKTT